MGDVEVVPRIAGEAPAVSSPAASRRLASAERAGTGPRAMALLAGVEAHLLDSHDRVRLLRAWAAQEGWLTAQRTAAVVAVAGPAVRPSGRSTRNPRVVDEESVVAEVACALRVSERTATNAIATARALHGPLRAAPPAVESGAWCFGHLRVAEDELVQPGSDLNGPAEDPAADAPGEARASAVVSAALDAALPHAATDTPAALRGRLRRALARLDAGAIMARAERAKLRRRLTLDPMPDLTGRLVVDGPWSLTSWIHRSLDTWARREQARLRSMRPADGPPVPGPTDDGVPTLAALRVDALVEAARLLALRTGSDSGPVRLAYPEPLPSALPAVGTVVPPVAEPPSDRRSWSQAVVVVPAAVALGLSDDPCYLPGYGLVPAAIGRELLADADTWRRFLVDDAGRVTDTGAVRYRPSPRLRQAVTAGTETCSFPYCTRPVLEADWTTSRASTAPTPSPTTSSR